MLTERSTPVVPARGAGQDADPGAEAGRGRERRPVRRALLSAAAAIVLTGGGYAAWTNTQPYTLQASIQINASPHRVWAILTDLPAYRWWNPFIVSSSGTVKVGATLTNRMHDATGTTTFTPTVQVVQPGHEACAGSAGSARAASSTARPMNRG